MVDNAEWLTRLNYIELLRDVGRHFSVNRMLTMDSVKLRLERDQELSFIEFNYMLLQAYDFVELARRYGCNLQMGGSDQWGNIVTGIDLGRRMGTHQLYALTCPLLTTSSGAKMGKTAAGAVWLNEEQLSAYDYWQFWRNTEDADVEQLLKLFTTLPLAEIAKLAALQGAEINEAKKVLATEATALLHGREKAGRPPGRPRRPSSRAPARACRRVEIAASELEAGLGVLAAFVQGRPCQIQRRGAPPDRRRRPARQRRARWRTRRRSSRRPTSADGVIKLSLGKKRHVLLRAGVATGFMGRILAEASVLQDSVRR